MSVEFPREILFDILLRLDVWNLCKFRCVSKSWNILIYDPSFVRSHMLRSMKNLHILLMKRGMNLLKNPSGPLDIDSLMRLISYDVNRFDDGPFGRMNPQFQNYLFRLISLSPFNFSTGGDRKFMIRQHQNINLMDPFDFEYRSCSFIFSCGGLVLLGNSFQETTMLRLMNPVNCRIHQLPLISEPYIDHLYHGRSCSSYGFVYSRARMEFKVVRFFPAKNGYGCQVLVLNDSPGWAMVYDGNLPIVYGNGTLAGGSLYFKTGGTDASILEFDVESRKITLVNDPPGWPQNSACDLMEINGELGRSNRKNTLESKVLEIWVLKDNENSVWEKTYSIKIRVRPGDSWIIPIYFMDEDTWFISYTGSVFMCDRSGEHFQQLVTICESWKCVYWENLSLL